MYILGIETSCDETAAAVVKDGRYILANVVASSLKEHEEYGGIIPEIASRRQIEFINLVIKKALTSAHLPLNKINAVAVTESPGLIGSLLVGVCFARALSFAIKKPLIGVDHIKAHLYANFLTIEKNPPASAPRLPAIGLVVSGGHTSLFLVKNFKTFQLLGQTRDDAAGEAFDKVARILKLGYPGGPIIDQLARTGQDSRIKFRSASIPDSQDFSFSGIKTAVLYYARDQWNPATTPVNHIAYSFQESVVTNLVSRCREICVKKKIKTLLIGGGVAANSALRERLTQEGEKNNIRVFFPPLNLCLDNAAMIAGLGYHWRRLKPHLN